jgi:predicted TIM-barrel fold metal-dependent hydrolase
MTTKLTKKAAVLLLTGWLGLTYPVAAFAADAIALSRVPRVDLHTHLDTLEVGDALLQVAAALQQRDNVRLAVAFNLQPFQPVGSPRPLTSELFAETEKRFGGRILSCIGDYNVPRGLQYTPDELAAWKARGVVGYKIWYPVVIGRQAPAPDQFTVHAPEYPGIDAPVNEPVFAAMERLGLVGTCIHIGQAHPRRWQEPTHFWTAVQSWLRVMERHPRLVVVMAHMMNLFYSDEQLDFLRYVLETYPNLHVELGGRFADFHAMKRDHLRAFMIRYADRILFGTDFAPFALRDGVEAAAERYRFAFQLLESDATVALPNGKAGAIPSRGLGLPSEVLAKIYFRNAARLYPRVKSVLRDQGFEVD